MDAYRVRVDGRIPDEMPDLAIYADAMAYALTFDETHEVHVERRIGIRVEGQAGWLCAAHHLVGSRTLVGCWALPTTD